MTDTKHPVRRGPTEGPTYPMCSVSDPPPSQPLSPSVVARGGVVIRRLNFFDGSVLSPPIFRLLLGRPCERETAGRDVLLNPGDLRNL